MFDYHIHSSLSFDSTEEPVEIARAALSNGLKEICFTDHYDYNTSPELPFNIFSSEAYDRQYGSLELPGLKIKHGVEFGMAEWNQKEAKELASWEGLDFIIGSVHFIDGHDPYEAVYWEERTVAKAFEDYLLGILACVKVHSDFDVLGHLTYVCKSVHNPSHAPVPFGDYLDITDEIMKILVSKGKGMEINTSGVDRAGCFLPQKEFLQRFASFGGEIVTVGSDSHDRNRVGQYVPEALEILKDVFGHVCTFEGRKPVFNKL
ncbi:MAG: histidinol-phosphatase HisJ family protein [Clostridia bacterium]|nr:histidinol-phosphatase HisJ family protein [Clostridia bacterium]